MLTREYIWKRSSIEITMLMRKIPATKCLLTWLAVSKAFFSLSVVTGC